jgi:hypothetical protein
VFVVGLSVPVPVLESAWLTLRMAIFLGGLDISLAFLTMFVVRYLGW